MSQETNAVLEGGADDKRPADQRNENLEPSQLQGRDAAAPSEQESWSGSHLWRGMARSYRHVRGFGGALLALIALCVYLSVTQEYFLTSPNILNVLAGSSSVMLVALGLTFVVLTCGFDLSVGALLATSGIVLYWTLDSGLPPAAAVGVALTSGLLLGGLVNGVLIGVLRLNFLVVTLATASLFGGTLAVLTNGQTHTIVEPEGSLIYFIGNGEVGGIPFPVVMCACCLGVCWYLLRFTRYGRAVYAVGGNPEAARMAGINATFVLVSVYAIVGLSAAMAGLVETSRLAAASPTAGTTMALTAAAAVLLGGTSLVGGVGGVMGTVVGVLLISFLQNGLGLMGVSAYWQTVLTGGVLLAAVVLDKLDSRPA